MRNRTIRIVANTSLANQTTFTLPVPDNMSGDVCDQSQVKAIAAKTLAAFPLLLAKGRGKKLEDGTTSYVGSGEESYAAIAAKINGNTTFKGKEKEKKPAPVTSPIEPVKTV